MILLAQYNKRLNAILKGKVIASFTKKEDIEAIRMFQVKQEEELLEFIKHRNILITK